MNNKIQKSDAAFKSELNFGGSNAADRWMVISTPLFSIHWKCSNSIVPFCYVFVVVVIVNDLLFCSPTKKKRHRAKDREAKIEKKKQIKIHTKPSIHGWILV